MDPALPPAYPAQWIDRWALRQGHAVTVRPVLPQDAALEAAFVTQGLTATSRYLRFQTGVQQLPPAMLAYFTQVDYHHHFALVVESFEGGTQQQVADARFVRDGEDPLQAEFALVVADAWQGLGLGRRLLRQLLAVARAQGLRRLTGDVLRSNTRMAALAAAEGFKPRFHPDDARLARWTRELDTEMTSPTPLAAAA